MPTYEYECAACGHAFERFQSMRDEPVQTCPECGGAVRRLISTGGGLVFKGPGFYATDYRSGPARGGGDGEKGEKREKGEKEEKKKGPDRPAGETGASGKTGGDGD
jgi:putative FmdB family regulatory protein